MTPKCKACTQRLQLKPLNLRSSPAHTHLHTHAEFVVWTIVLNEVDPSSRWQEPRCHLWCQGWNQWEHYTNRPVKQRGGFVAPCSFTASTKLSKKTEEGSIPNSFFPHHILCSSCVSDSCWDAKTKWCHNNAFYALDTWSPVKPISHRFTGHAEKIHIMNVPTLKHHHTSPIHCIIKSNTTRV